MRRDIQELIPATHRDLIEAIPRGFPKSAVTAGLLLGTVAGALLTLIVPEWIAAAVPASLMVVQQIWVRKSNREFDRQIKELEARDFDWKTHEDA